MTALAIVLLAAVLAVAAAYHFTSADQALRSRTKRRVLVTTHGGGWFAGVLLEHDRRSFVLTNVTTEGPDGQQMPVDGEVLILAEDVAHIQFP